MNIEIELIGTSPLLMHNPRMVDPDFELSRQIKPLAAKRKKTDADLKEISRLEWYGGLYEDEDGMIVQPASKVRKCLINTGRISKLGKAIERTITLGVMNIPLGYEGPRNKDEMFKDERFHSRLSVGIKGSRVMRTRPQFFPWSLVVTGLFVADAGLNYDELEELVRLAGVIEGIGDNRVNGYGRFQGSVKKL